MTGPTGLPTSVWAETPSPRAAVLGAPEVSLISWVAAIPMNSMLIRMSPFVLEFGGVGGTASVGAEGLAGLTGQALRGGGPRQLGAPAPRNVTGGEPARVGGCAADVDQPRLNAAGVVREPAPWRED